MFQEPDQASVEALLRSMTGRRVLVVGDGMLDGYIYGHSSRLSPEAPVQVVDIDREEYLLGGAANVAKILISLGAKVSICCAVGNDAEAKQFLDDAAGMGIDTHAVVHDPAIRTTLKLRIVSGRQHVVRVDRDPRAPYAQKTIDALVELAASAAAAADAVLLSDYAKGVLTEAVCAAAIRGAAGKPVLVDPKGKDWKKYSGATLIKPNFGEARTFIGVGEPSATTLNPSTDNVVCEHMAANLRESLKVANVAITRGPNGITLAKSDGTQESFPGRHLPPKDEAGAGDAVAAATCLALAAGASLEESVWLGNLAGAVMASKFATQAVSDFELLEALGASYPSSRKKLMTVPQAAEFAAMMRKENKNVVFTNGCFDILHLGHTTYLESARQLGDALIVAINTDDSVRRLNKGPNRPVNPEGDRSRLISSLACVDAVVLFGEDTPYEIIKSVKPHVLCKGADYKSKQDVVGWDIVEANGGRVALIPLVEGRSTSKVIEKMSQ